MDLDPFVPVGITEQTCRFLDVFLMHCLLTDSPPDTPQEIAELARNQHRVAARGREPGLTLERHGEETLLLRWGASLLDELSPIARAMDEAHDGRLYQTAVESAVRVMHEPHALPSARVLADMARDHGNLFIHFTRAHAQLARDALLALPYAPALQAKFEEMARASIDAQKAIEAADTMPFEQYRQQYVAPQRLEVQGRRPR